MLLRSHGERIASIIYVRGEIEAQSSFELSFQHCKSGQSRCFYFEIYVTFWTHKKLIIFQILRHSIIILSTRWGTDKQFCRKLTSNISVFLSRCCFFFFCPLRVGFFADIRQRWRCSGLLWPLFSTWRLEFFAFFVCLLSQPEGKWQRWLIE